MLYMLALVGQPNLRGRDACVVLRVRGWHPEEIEGKNFLGPFFSPLFVFLLRRISVFYGVVWLWLIFWRWLGIG